MLFIIVVWPFFMVIFLNKNKKSVDDDKFKVKFISMYVGIKTNKLSSLAYSSTFCLRRLLLVAALGVLGKNEYFVLVAYHIIQTAYFWYMIDCVPHEEKNYNRLEVFAELCLIILQNIMILFIVGSNFDPLLQWNLGYVLTVTVVTVFLANLLFLIYSNCLKIIAFCRQRKAKREAQKNLDAKKAEQEQMQKEVATKQDDGEENMELLNQALNTE